MLMLLLNMFFLLPLLNLIIFAARLRAAVKKLSEFVALKTGIIHSVLVGYCSHVFAHRFAYMLPKTVIKNQPSNAHISFACIETNVMTLSPAVCMCMCNVYPYVSLPGNR